MSPQVYRYVEGLYRSVYFTEQSIRSALNYSPEPEDVFIVSCPKSGTTWTQFLVYNIFSGGHPPKDFDEFTSQSPFLELNGAQSVKKMRRPGTIKTHLPFSRHRYSNQAKYLYIARNPYDVCTSFYYHTKSFPAYFFESGTFDEFFDMFLEGRADSGDYFDILLPWYDHRDEPNVLFMTYEGLKRDTEGWVLKMADFLGDEYGAKLRRDPNAVKSVVEMSSLRAMRKVFTRTHDIPDETWPTDEDPSQCFEESVLAAMKKPMTGDYIRKGVVGDWKNHFSNEQVARMKNWIGLRTTGSDVMELWKDEDLP